MRKNMMQLVISVVVGLGGLLIAQEEASPAVKALHSQAEKEFETVVTRFAGFFEVKPKMLVAEAKGNSRDTVYYVNEFACRKINYEVQTSQDEKVELTGNLLLSISRRDNRGCGDVAGVVMLGPKIGWREPQPAIANDSKESCFRQSRKAGLQEIRLQFIYQDGQWNFQSAKNETTGTGASLISDALKGEFFSQTLRDYNIRWSELVNR